MDERGIVRVGARIEPGDILIGKITPKGESDPSPEEKLLRAIFGDKAGDVKDASLKATPSLRGVVIETALFSKAVKKRKSRLTDKAILPKLDEEYEMKMADLKNLLVDKLLVLTNGKVSQGVKDYMNTEIIAKGVKFSRKALEELDYNSIQVSKWTADADKNELIKQVILNYLKKYKELDAELRRKKFDLTIGDDCLPVLFRWLRFTLLRNVRSRLVIRWLVVMETRVLFPKSFVRKICHSWKTELRLISV